MSEVDYDDLCELYVDGAPDTATLKSWLGVPAGMDIIVDENENTGDKTDPDNGFLFSAHLAELYFVPDATHQHRVQTVSAIITDLRDRGLKVTAACDYEDELPS